MCLPKSPQITDSLGVLWFFIAFHATTSTSDREMILFRRNSDEIKQNLAAGGSALLLLGFATQLDCLPRLFLFIAQSSLAWSCPSSHYSWASTFQFMSIIIFHLGRRDRSLVICFLLDMQIWLSRFLHVGPFAFRYFWLDTNAVYSSTRWLKRANTSLRIDHPCDFVCPLA